MQQSGAAGDRPRRMPSLDLKPVAGAWFDRGRNGALARSTGPDSRPVEAVARRRLSADRVPRLQPRGHRPVESQCVVLEPRGRAVGVHRRPAGEAGTRSARVRRPLRGLVHRPGPGSFLLRAVPQLQRPEGQRPRVGMGDGAAVSAGGDAVPAARRSESALVRPDDDYGGVRDSPRADRARRPRSENPTNAKRGAAENPAGAKREPAAPTVVSRTGKGNSCGPCALLNALKFGGAAERAAVAKIPGEDDAARVRSLIAAYGNKPSELHPDRKRSTKSGEPLLTN